MPSTTLRLTLVNNAKQTQRSGVLLKLDDQSDAVVDLLTLARNKLRLKRAKTLYLAHGIDVTDKAAWFVQGQVAQDSLVYVSCGEVFVGQVANPSTSTMNEEGKDVDNSAVQDVKVNLTPQTRAQLGLYHKKKSHVSRHPAATMVLAKKSFVDPEAEAQLKRVALMPGMCRVVGQPDLHPGQATPIGATFITRNLIYPALIGNDIGCGMAVYKTRLSSSIRPDKIVNRLVGLEGPWTRGDPYQFLTNALGSSDNTSSHSVSLDQGQDPSTNLHLDQLGTLGGGNHFAEFVVVDSLVDTDLCTAFNITDDKTYLIVHTGSRKFGQAVLEASRTITTATQASSENNNNNTTTTSTSTASTTDGLYADSEAGRKYLAQHDLACQWARANRELVAHRVLTRLDAEQDAVKLLDIWHNHVERKELDPTEASELLSTDDTADNHSSGGNGSYWIHRKGAAPSDRGLVVIPGSRGHHSYLVMPHDRPEESLGIGAGVSGAAASGNGLFNGFSLAHGAGRQWTRAKARQKQPVATSRQGSIAALQTTELGSMVVCEDMDLLFEEQPEAYKDIYDVIHDLLPFAKIVAILRPIATYKMRNEKHRSS
ncbi:hypothetical protein BGZ73_007850 [Actinomortierella ambigua]|nr:hypothetical protein BGZ73_007850 [Actinomortierella ambigua]